MNCAEAEIMLHALLDGEFDAGHARGRSAYCEPRRLRRKARRVPDDAHRHWHWSEQELAFWAVGDRDGEELGEFAGKIAAALRPGSAS